MTIEEQTRQVDIMGACAARCKGAADVRDYYTAAMVAMREWGPPVGGNVTAVLADVIREATKQLGASTAPYVMDDMDETIAH